LVAKLLPEQQQKLDTEFRYLPKPTQGQCLLDIGCGNGSFLVSAREAGWHVTGLEPDPEAADAARQQGVDVIVGTIDALGDESNCFDAITLSHVIEHVHEPLHLLQAVHRLLKPGGIVFIETPNIQSNGALMFKNNWRGLETPRHLVLFNPVSLTNLLSNLGYHGIKTMRRTIVGEGMYLRSIRMAGGNSPYDSEPAKLAWLTRLRIKLSFTKTNRLEFISVLARKECS
jgi:SAM-dependent methyltransferase